MDVGGRESGSSAAPAAQIAARESSLVRIKCFSPLKAGWVQRARRLLGLGWGVMRGGGGRMMPFGKERRVTDKELLFEVSVLKCQQKCI